MTEPPKPGRFISRKPERRKRSQSEMGLVDKVLPDVMQNLGLEKRLREHALMQVWETLLPRALAERSRPLFIDHQQNLVVAVSDASVAQELSLMKGKLIQSLAATARSLGLELRALRLDMKNFHRAQDEPEPPVELRLPQPSDRDLLEFELGEHDKQLIVELSKKLSEDPLNSGHFDEKALRAFETQLKLLEWRRRNGYPCCQRCSNPVLRLHLIGAYKLCFNCTLLAE